MLPPEKVAALLAREGVRYAALTDHDTVAGLERFEGVLEREGVGVIPGVEITTAYGGREIHILGYGFAPEHDGLRSALRIIRRERNFRFHSALGTLRESLQRGPGAFTPSADEASSAPFTCGETIALIHDAGGRAFLAHPLQLVSDPEELERILAHLKEAGLDGIEAHYAPYTPEQRSALTEMARRQGLLVVAGTDFHRMDEAPCDQPGIDVPTQLWKDFRDALSAVREPNGEPRQRRASRDHALPHRYWLRWRRFILRIILPVVLTIVLFVITLFAVLLPATERALMARKREMSKELTALVISMLEEYEQDVESGEINRDEAQALAIERLRGMRYGPESKDYFWATDTHPVMVFHPYRPELEGEDLTTFVDARGKRLFVEFVAIVEQGGEGYAEYLWQWKDNPSRIESKLSYVRLFKPWGWVVGTGMYLDDVEDEIHHLTNRLVTTSVIITVLVALLLAFIAQQSFALEHRRRRTEEALHTSHEKYRTLVEAASEGTMMVLDGQCAYANRALLDRLGYAEEELPLLDLYDILPHARSEDNETVRYFTDLLEGKPCPPEFRGQLRQRTGIHVDAELSVRHISLGERRGFVVTVRNTGMEPSVQSGGEASATAPWLIQDLQASVMFLNESIAPFLSEPVTCGLDTPIRDAARLMSAHDMSAVFVTAPSEEPVGIITDGDLRDRVLAAGADPARPVYEIMSSPIVHIDDQALVYEAVLRMQERQLRHLAVRDATGAVVGMVRREDLLQFHRYASAVVTREIQRAESPEAIAKAHARLPAIVAALLESGTRPQSVMRFISAVHDAATAQLLRLAIDEAGPPPARFAFICMGSQGRQEETLVTDQDNGIVYEDIDGESRAAAARAYFETLGKQICSWLDAVGYDYCIGGIMAQNPLWRGPLSKWKKQLGGWIGASEPGDILKFDMFFDFRCVYGATDIAHALRTSVFEQVKSHDAFLMHFARNAIRYKPPLGWFGQIRTRSSGEETPTVDLKEAMMPIVEFARIYAIREHFVEANTLARLNRMSQMGLLSDTGHEETVVAYEFLMRLRLREQANAIAAGEKPSNNLAPDSLTQIEIKTLREAFSQITTIQSHLSYDFLGVDET